MSPSLSLQCRSVSFRQARRRQVLTKGMARLEILDARCARWRLIEFSSFFGITLWLALHASLLTWPTAAAGLMGFVLILRGQSRVARQRERYMAYLALLERDDARRALDWSRLPPGSGLEAPEAPRYFTDLDLAGEFSLLRLLNATVSDQGFRKLGELLTSNGISDEEIRTRQRRVRELRDLPLFRRQFLAAAEGSRLALDDLIRLAESPGISPECQARTRLGLAVLSLWQLAGFFLLALYLVRDFRPYFLLVWLGAWAVFKSGEEKGEEAFGRALSLERTLAQFAGIARQLERARARPGSTLEKRLTPFHGPARPSAILAGAARVVSAFGVRGNPFLHLLVNLVLPWDLFWRLRLEDFRAKLAGSAPEWVREVSELEAFVSLAGFAELFPEYAWPELDPEGSWIAGAALGHPLIPADQRVTNDFALGADQKCVIITGSNMSGKSTFLRTLGVNLILAKAGAPVAAQALQFRNMDLQTSMRVTDSLREQVSSFYAEVKDLKSILMAAQSPDAPPLFYIVDEIFQGTNHRERLIGSYACILALLKTKAVGLVSTHDLELAEIEREASGVANFHFRETIEDGRMAFHYRLEPGPCPTTNALRIMEMEGLPVDVEWKRFQSR